MYPTQLHSYLLWRSSVDPTPQSLASRRYTAIVALFPAAMVGIFVFGWWAGLVVLASVLAAFATDFVCHRYIYRDTSGTRDGVWFLTGLLLGLMMPPNAPLWLPILGAVAAVYFGKFFLSVDGMPLFQPAALGLVLLHVMGVLALVFSGNNPMTANYQGEARWPVLVRGVEPNSEAVREGNVPKLLTDFFGGDVRKSVPRMKYRDAIFSGQLAWWDEAKTIPAEAVHGPRPLDLVKQNPGKPSNRLETARNAAAKERYDWVDMLLGYLPATIGGSSVFALGFGIFLLVFARSISWVVPFFALATIFGLLHGLAWAYGSSLSPRVISDNIPIHLMTGSTLLGIFYFAADPTTAPRSFMGKVYAGVAVGLVEVFLRIFTPMAESIFLSVLIVQGLSFVIDLHLAPPEDGRSSAGVDLTPSSLGRL